MEEAGAELARERARENEENRLQIDQEEEWMNGAEGDVEDEEDEEEGDENETGQVRPGIRDDGGSEAGTKMRRLLRGPDEETEEDTETDTDAEAETRTILGTARDVADDEDNGQDTE
jgi:hypothetical protein